MLLKARVRGALDASRAALRGALSSAVALICAISLSGLTASPAEAKNLPVIKPVMDCAALGNMLFKVGDDFGRIMYAKPVAADAGDGNAGTVVPSPYCEIKGHIAPQIAFELRLPTVAWTQRLLFSGCGGFCGQARIRPNASTGCPQIENGQMAMVATDMGHTSFGSESSLWTSSDGIFAANNPQGRKDYADRAVHMTTVFAKAIMKKYYGSAPAYSYFTGCSDGGRAAMMAPQRHPEDFDGVISGSAGLDLITQNAQFDAWRVQHLLKRDGTHLLTDEQEQTLHKGVMEECAARSGQFEGLIEDPRTCHYDPAKVGCDRKPGPACLTADQVMHMKELYRGPHDAAGHEIYFPYPYGSELGWNEQIDGADLFVKGLVTFLTSSKPVDDLNVWDMPQTLEQKAIYLREFGAELNSLVPDMSAYKSRGGKVIMWHPWADESVPPMSTVAYYQSVRATMGAKAADEFMRVYMIPGVYHCGKGLGRDRIDLLDPLMAWVEDGVPPGAVPASLIGTEKQGEQNAHKVSIVPLRLDR
jgi:feruloyl esterase